MINVDILFFPKSYVSYYSLRFYTEKQIARVWLRRICVSYPLKKEKKNKTQCVTTRPIRVNRDHKNYSYNVIIIVFQSVARRDGVRGRIGFLFLYCTRIYEFRFDWFSLVFTRNKTLKSRHSYPPFRSLTIMLKIVPPIIIVNDNNKLSVLTTTYTRYS